MENREIENGELRMEGASGSNAQRLTRVIRGKKKGLPKPAFVGYTNLLIKPENRRSIMISNNKTLPDTARAPAGRAIFPFSTFHFPFSPATPNARLKRGKNPLARRVFLPSAQ
jgi:hypothetical protein